MYLHRRSQLSDVVNVTRSSMGDWQSSLALTGRLPVSTDHTTFTYIPFPLVSEESWQYFVVQSSHYGELHIYVTTTPPQHTNTGFMGLLTGIMQPAGAITTCNTSYDGSVPHNIPNEEQQIYTDYSTYTERPEQSIRSTDSENEDEYAPSTASSDREMQSMHFNFEDNHEMHGEQPRRRGKAPMRDADIGYYHTGFSFGQGYNENEEFIPRYSPTKNVLEVGMEFENYEDLKKAVTAVNMSQRKQFKTTAKRINYWHAICLYSTSGDQQCFWSLSASQRKGARGEWVIKKYHSTHTCRIDYNQGRQDFICTSTVIGELVKDKLAIDPGYKVKHIVLDVKKAYGIDVKDKKAWYGRLKGIQSLYGKWDQSYNDLPKFLHSVCQTNPGTVIDFQTMPSSEGENFCEFLYAFWAFKPAIDGFRYCLPVITIDGTHLYGKYKGHLLLAVAKNANKEIFPLAYSIVDSENSKSWSWFLRLLARNFFANGESICIISDRHRGIESAFKKLPELQHVHHRCCLRHLRSNVMTTYRNKWLKKYVWEAGNSVRQSDFDMAMQTIQEIDPAAHKYLTDIPPEYWALSHDGGHRYGIMTTNSSESFNNTLKGCRMLPVTAIARLTFHKLVAMFLNRRSAGELMQQAGLRWPTNIDKEMSAREQYKYNATIRPYNNQRGIYEVALQTTSNSMGQLSYVNVNLTTKTCSCGHWAVDGLPCAHVIAACHYRGTVPDSFVPQVFSLQYYIMSYAGELNALLEDEIQLTSTVTCLPPSNARQKVHRGQQRTSRYPNEMDYGRRH